MGEKIAKVKTHQDALPYLCITRAGVVNKTRKTRLD